MSRVKWPWEGDEAGPRVRRTAGSATARFRELLPGRITLLSSCERFPDWGSVVGHSALLAELLVIIGRRARGRASVAGSALNSISEKRSKRDRQLFSGRNPDV